MNVDIAERLAKRRREAGYSQESLAEKLGVSRQAVSKWERSESSPDTDNLIALAQLYGVSLDDLLYVDHSIKDDVVFEAADRAAQRSEKDTPSSAKEGSTPAEENQDYTESAEESIPSDDSQVSSGKRESVKIGAGGIHVLDGDDYVHVSWRDGVHVKDSETGEEVHVGWNGIHVTEAGSQKNKHSKSPQNKTKNPAVECGVFDDSCEAFKWSGDGVTINGEHYESWKQAHDAYDYSGWKRPSGYTVAGEWFDNIDDARNKYGDQVGKGIPVSRHYFKRAWLKFPYFLVALILYLLAGFMYGEWGLGLFVFFTVPVYYMIGHALASKQIAPFIAGIYPLASVVWFLYMAFVLNEPHPAWVIFLTIPIFEWIVHEVSKGWRSRKKKAHVIDV